MNKQHTPTPWSAGYIDPDLPGGFIESANGKNVAIYYAGPETAVGEEGEANAAFIVRAANNHETLLAACKHALAKCVGELEPIRAAIAKAEGK